MHIRRGLPLTSALHEPHLPALQFQRTARSGACVAWIVWMTSRTTWPSSASTAYSSNSPAAGVAAEDAHRDVRHQCASSNRLASSGGIGGSGSRADCHLAARALAHDDVHLRPTRGPGRGSPRACGRRGSPCAARRPARSPRRRQHRLAGRSPGASPGCTGGGLRRRAARALLVLRRASCSASSSSAFVRMMPTRFCIVSWSSCWMVYGFSPSRPVEGPSIAFAASSASPSSTAGVEARPFGVLRRAEARPPAEDEQVGERVAAEAVRAVHAAGAFAGREQAGHRRGGGVGVHADAAHDVVHRRADLHRHRGDVDVGELLELVVHARQAPPDVLRRCAGWRYRGRRRRAGCRGRPSPRC